MLPDRADRVEAVASQREPSKCTSQPRRRRLQRTIQRGRSHPAMSTACALSGDGRASGRESDVLRGSPEMRDSRGGAATRLPRSGVSTASRWATMRAPSGRSSSAAAKESVRTPLVGSSRGGQPSPGPRSIGAFVARGTTRSHRPRSRNILDAGSRSRESLGCRQARRRPPPGRARDSGHSGREAAPQAPARKSLGSLEGARAGSSRHSRTPGRSRQVRKSSRASRS
jgi:hypothetical protein